jgi:hypothetical protein
MFEVPDTTDRDEILSAVRSGREPTSASSADGQLRTAGVPLADRVEAVRRATEPTTPGSCNYTGWGN